MAGTKTTAARTMLMSGGRFVDRRRQGRGLSGLASAGYETRPLSFGCYFDDHRGAATEARKTKRNGRVVKTERLNPYAEHYRTMREVYIASSDSGDDSGSLSDDPSSSESSDNSPAAPFETDECTALHEWQSSSRPSCNVLHESDLTDFDAEESLDDASVRLIANGWWRDVWLLQDSYHRKAVVKTMRYEHDYTEANFDRHRRDAVMTDRLKSSPNIVDIYAYCGNSGVYQYADGGDVGSVIWPKDHDSNDEERKNSLTKLDKLRIATQIAIAVADTHNIDKEGEASIVHNDITPYQFVLINGFFKLNDFNRSRFMRKYKKDGKPCGFVIGKNAGRDRSPEEYRYDEQTEKVDVYDMGNVFYSLLTGLVPFDEFDSEDVPDKVMAGERPPVPDEILDSDDPMDKVLVEAMEMCHIHDPTDRPSARDIEIHLKRQLKQLLQ